MKTVVIHVGTHKTGTTALQLFFTLNTEQLRQHGIHYVVSGRGGAAPENHHGLALAMKTDRSSIPRQVADEIASSKCSKHLVSSEVFMEFDAPRKLRTLFSDYRVQIVMYVRRQDFRTLSEYNYAVKIFVARFSGVIQDYYLCKKYWPYLDYHVQLERYAQVFGRENVLARVCEQGAGESSIYEDFLELLEVPWSSAFRLPKDNAANRSLDLPCLEFKRLCNKAAMTHDEDARLADALGKIRLEDAECAAQSLLSPSERLELVDRYHESNRRVARDYLDRNELFTPPLPKVDEDSEPFAGLPPRDFERIASQLVEQCGYTPAEMGHLVDRIVCANSSQDWQPVSESIRHENPWYGGNV